MKINVRNKKYVDRFKNYFFSNKKILYRSEGWLKLRVLVAVLRIRIQWDPVSAFWGTRI